VAPLWFAYLAFPNLTLILQFFRNEIEVLEVRSPDNIEDHLWVLSETTCIGIIQKVTKVEICLPPGALLVSTEYRTLTDESATPTMLSTAAPTAVPTQSSAPSISSAPSTVPSLSAASSLIPSTLPSTSPSSDTRNPSAIPSGSLSPSGIPSDIPSSAPSTCLLSPVPNSDWAVIPANSDPNIGQHETCFVLANNGKAYMFGGRLKEPVCEYDPNLRTWKCSETDIPQRLHHMQCLAIGDDIWIASSWGGSFPDEDNKDNIFIYSPSTDSFSTRTGLDATRARGGAANAYDPSTNSIYVSHGNTGGHDAFSESVTLLDRYDIDTDTWTALSDGLIARDHTGGAIINGELCVAAGRNGESVASTILPTECYNIATDTWSLRESIAVGRGGSAYGTTCDGRLMVAGGESGEDGGKAHDEVSVFDGTSWEEFPSLIVARHGTGLAVDCSCGQIFIAGGSPIEGGPEGNGGLQITEHFLPGGVDEVCSSVVTECEEPEAGWSIVPAQLEDDNFETQSTACFVQGNDGLSYLIGGYNKHVVCRYDPDARSWECDTGDNIPRRTHHSQCVVVGNEIWFASAWGNQISNAESLLAPVQVYNYVDKIWLDERTGIDADRLRAGAATAHFEGFLYVSHGTTDDHTSGSTAFLDRYDIANDEWEALPDASFARDHTGGGIVNGEFCVAGGRDSDGNQVEQTECYNIAGGTWSTKASLAVPRSHSSYGTTCDGKLMVAGGEDGNGVLDNVSVFDGTSWEEFPSLTVPRHGTTTLAMDCPCGQIYMATGATEPGNVEEGIGAFATEHYFPDGINQACDRS
jgi:hypothetical protein